MACVLEGSGGVWAQHPWVGRWPSLQVWGPPTPGSTAVMLGRPLLSAPAGLDAHCTQTGPGAQRPPRGRAGLAASVEGAPSPAGAPWPRQLLPMGCTPRPGHPSCPTQNPPPGTPRQSQRPRDNRDAQRCRGHCRAGLGHSHWRQRHQFRNRAMFSRPG